MDSKKRAEDLVAQMTLGEKISQLLYNAPAIERLNVPDYNWWNECLHGVGRAGVATVFPQAIAMAASFNKELMFDVATAISDEARAKHYEYDRNGDHGIYKGLTFWSPNINIFRDPRWGRGHETYGEDPYLTGVLGTAFIKGLQGDDDTYRKLDSTIKHYAVHSGPESLRHSFDVQVDPKDLYETYLWAFRYCIRHGKPAAVMGAYNRVNGEPCCGSKTLLQDILRDEFGFEGYVVSDCGAVCDINEHHKVTPSLIESSALAVNNGCDLNCGHAYLNLMAAVEKNLITEETITRAAERLFETRYKLGMFDENVPYDKIPYDVIHCDAHKSLARKMAQEGIVLLKNDGILPLRDDLKSIAVIGPNAHVRDILLGNYHGTPEEDVTILEGVRNRFKDSKVYYSRGCHIVDEEKGDWSENVVTEAVIVAKRSDVVILCIGLSPCMEGEEGDAFNADASGDKNSIELPKSQKILLDRIIALKKPLIIVNVSGSALALNEADANANAMLQLFYPGEQGGNAVADVLSGDYNPSGKLPVTFYKSDADLPPFTDYSMKNRTYRYFEKGPLYPFGYGLCYSKVVFDKLSLEKTKISKEESLQVSISVENQSIRDAEPVIQVYLKALDPSFSVPKYQMVEFKKVYIAGNSKQTVTFVIAPENRMLTDEQGKEVLPLGVYKLYAGGGQPEFEDCEEIEFQVI